MLDLNLIREKPDMVKAAMRDLNAEAPIDEILDLVEGLYCEAIRRCALRW